MWVLHWPSATNEVAIEIGNTDLSTHRFMSYQKTEIQNGYSEQMAEDI